jgi:hypothetical protein
MTSAAFPRSATSDPSGRSADWAARAAALVGILFAAVSGYWGLGGRWLLDTVGGGLESAGRSGSVVVGVLVWAAVAAKLVAVVLPILAVRSPTGKGSHLSARPLAWVEAVVLTGYGAVLTVVGLLVQLGILPAGADADHRALAWHTYLWDPWFLAWGLLVTAALLASRRVPGSGSRVRDGR